MADEFFIPRIDRDYLFFLVKVPKEELEQLGYGKEPGVFYRPYRMWQGAVALSDQLTDGSANVFAHRVGLKGLIENWRDLLTATEQMSMDLSIPPSEARLSGLRLSAQVSATLADAAEKDDAKALDALKTQLGQPLLQTLESPAVYENYNKTTDLAQKKLLAVRLRFLAEMDKAKLKWAENRQMAATQPTTGPATQSATRPSV
jgi:hypothetical protein